MKGYMDLTQARLKELLHYDPQTGGFNWIKPKKGVRSHGRAGYKRKRGDVIICVDYVHHMAHRLAWLYMTGSFPDSIIDHINRDPGDNRWANLRLATVSLNGANQPVRTASGLKGAYGAGSRWFSIITINGKTKYLGMHSTAEAAHAAYMEEARQAFGAFAGN